jgi:hypothetical protein
MTAPALVPLPVLAGFASVVAIAVGLIVVATWWSR